ncbi:MAG: bifunctional (p)ppGpp synthetase/guanosine-3',5'-bis(diphosphate) 3'-pyrophosphohydrolase [Clostridia bacterium]|nr:bifunctional (p)ppGpp synthetase/guanosine-3',5'-bis(diphosphate) 3'-pyrophosphohydrolase [Clostridia bacterium]
MIDIIKDKRTTATYEDLLELINQNDDLYDKEKIYKAYLFADNAHKGQVRRSGLAYITHPLCVACILVGLGMDTDSICAALLHDVVEDTPVELSEIKKLFGKDVALLIDGVTKLNKFSFVSKEEEQAENIRKMFLAMAKDIRVVIIKLADRVHNLRTLEFMPDQKRRDIAHETMTIYSHLAHRLGIRSIKDEMENVCLLYLDPVGYKEIEQSLSLKSEERNKFITVIKEQVKQRISKYIPDVHISGRVKSINGIYRKTFVQGKTMEQIYDIYAIRVIVHSVNDCYNVLGIIHDMYTPLPNRFKDYISTPKANMYQSLHTTVLGKEQIPFEVQIRTWDMHHTAEYGIAAHWKYKTGVRKSDSFEDRLVWIKQILETQENTDTTDLISTIKTDLSSDEIIVLTPAGKAITLPKGATPIDFAYAIHSDVGHRMTGAKINSKIAPIDTLLKDGQVVEILTRKDSKGPKRDWLNIVKTNQAKNKIRQWFKKEHREENIIHGKSELEFEFRRNGIRLTGEKLDSFLKILSKRQRCKTLDDFYAAIGYGGISLWKLMPRIKDDYAKTLNPEETKAINSSEPIFRDSSSSVIIADIQDCLIKFAKCCNPLPGDDIIGFITRGSGVSIHNRLCKNVPKDLKNAENPERWINARWSNMQADKFDSTLRIKVINRGGILASVTTELSSMKLFIKALNTRNVQNGQSIIYATITVNGLDHLNTVIKRLMKLDGIVDVSRA